MSTFLTEPAAPAAPAASTESATSTVATETPTAAPAATVPPESPRWTVPENMREDATIKKFMDDKFGVDPGVLAQSYINLQQTIGRDKITIPKSEDEFSKAYDALGRPANAEAYQVTKPEKMPEGVTYDEAGEKLLREFGYANGWNQKQFQNAYDMYFKTRMDEISGWQTTLKESRDNLEGSLKKEWGDAYTGNSELARSLVKEFGDPEFSQYLDQSGVGNDPRITKFLVKIAKEMMGESKLKDPRSSTSLAPAEIDAKIKEFRSTNEKALFNADHPDHKRLVAELQRLYDSRPVAAA